jgi:hypothetical protein
LQNKGCQLILKPDPKSTNPQEAATLLSEAARIYCCLRCLASHRAFMQEGMHFHPTFLTSFCDWEASLGLAKFSVLDSLLRLVTAILGDKVECEASASSNCRFSFIARTLVARATIGIQSKIYSIGICKILIGDQERMPPPTALIG